MKNKVNWIEIIRLIRVKHYIKNVLVLFPLFFSHKMFDINYLKGFIGFLAFCLISSAVYIYNDIRDVDNDRKHPVKKNRPLASGAISIHYAVIVMIIFLFCGFILDFLSGSDKSSIYIVIYIAINVLYSLWLKNIPIIDIAALSSGYVIRVLYGGGITGTPVSEWLYLVIISCALYLGLGKRRNEYDEGNESRNVLKYYNRQFLDKFMTASMSLVIVFYALWTMDSVDKAMRWTTPLVILILMKYSLSVEGTSDGDPVEVVLHDIPLIFLIFIYGIIIFLILYGELERIAL